MDANVSQHSSLSCDKVYQHDGLKLPRTLLTATATILIISGNILCVLCIRKTAAFSSNAKVFVTSLSVADLMMGVFISFPSTISASFSAWTLGSTTCLITAHLNFFLVTMSALSLLLVSVDRYLAVTKHLRYQTLVTTSRAMSIVIVVWVLTTIFSLTVYFESGRHVCYDAMLNICIPITMPDGGISYSTLASFVLVILVSYLTTLAIYVRLYRIARKHARLILEVRDNFNPVLRPAIHPRHKATTTFLIVVVAYGVAYIPMLVIAIDFIVTEKGCTHVICGLASVCTLSDSWWNVAIYSIRTSSFRQAAKRMLQCGCRRMNQIKPDENFQNPRQGTELQICR